MARYFDQNNFNPLRSLKVDNDLVYNRLLSSNYININPIEGLNLRSTFSIDYAQKQQNKYTRMIFMSRNVMEHKVKPKMIEIHVLYGNGIIHCLMKPLSVNIS